MAQRVGKSPAQVRIPLNLNSDGCLHRYLFVKRTTELGGYLSLTRTYSSLDHSFIFTCPLSNAEREDPSHLRLVHPFRILLTGDNTVAPAAWRYRDTQVSDRIEGLGKQGNKSLSFVLSLCCVRSKSSPQSSVFFVTE